MTTPANTPVRAATVGELATLRGPKQGAILGLAVSHNATVYTARINQTFDTLDGITEVTYDTGSGTLEDIRIGMTVLFGSAAGLSDLGIARIRKIPTSSLFYINQSSDLQLADDVFITVLDEFRLWQRDIFFNANTLYVDYDLPYSIGYGGVIPRIGPLMAVLHTTFTDPDYEVSFVPPDPLLSAAYDGATITEYFFECAAATVNNPTSAANVSFDFVTDGTPQLVRWSCVITDDLGRTTTSYRWIYIDPPAVSFEIVQNPVGDYESGDWSFSVKLNSSAAQTDIRDQAMVTLYAKDFYDDVQGSIGKLTGYENIVCTGWIDGESIQWNSEQGSVTFTVHGANYWMQKLRAFPFELVSTSTAPTTWNQIQDMTTDKALAHILFHTTTAPAMMDVFLSGDTNTVGIFSSPPSNLMVQLESIALNTIFAKPLTNNYGQMFIEIDTQIISSTDRAALPVVMDVQSGDHEAPLTLERSESPRISSVEFTALMPFDGLTAQQVYSRAPGLVGKTYGDIQSFDNYVVLDQDEANRISGALLANLNNPYNPIDIPFYGNLRLFDIAPRMYATITISSDDNPRGMALTTARLIPRRVEFGHDPDTGEARTSVSFELEAIGVDGVTYTPPVPTLENIDTSTPDFGDLDFPDLTTDFPTDIPLTVIDCGTYGENTVNGFGVSWSKSAINGTDTDPTAKIYFPCTIHSTSGSQTSLVVNLRFFGDADTSKIAVYAIDGTTRVLTGTLASTSPDLGGRLYKLVYNFSPLSLTTVDGFEIELTAGAGAVVSYEVGTNVTSGTVAGNAGSPTTINGLTVGNYYQAAGFGGPWYGFGPGDPNYLPLWYLAVYDSTRAASMGFDTVSGTWNNNALTLALEVGKLDTKYGYMIFQAQDTYINIYHGDPNPTDNSGQISCVVRNVTATGRKITLGNASVRNVCPAS